MMKVPFDLVWLLVMMGSLLIGKHFAAASYLRKIGALRERGAPSEEAPSSIQALFRADGSSGSGDRQPASALAPDEGRP